MANSSPDDGELSGSPDNDANHDARTHQVERLVVAGAIIGPVLLGLWAWYERSDGINPWTLRSGSMVVFQYVRITVLQGLAIWLAWRQPILGGKIAKPLFVALLTWSACAIAYVWPFDSFATGHDPRTMMLFMITTLFASFLLDVAGFVLMRRLFAVVLIKRKEPKNYQPIRLSIRELMLWTLVIAGCLSFYHNLQRWAAHSNVEMVNVPGWFNLYTLVMAYGLPPLLAIAVVHCWRFAFRKWLPVVMCIYLLVCFANSLVTRAVYIAYLELNTSDFGSFWNELIHAAIHVLITVFIIWAFGRFGYRFQVGSPVSASPDLPA